MVSGAGHDAAVMALLTPMTMLFIRSPGGISHHPAESVVPADVTAALEVMVALLLNAAKHWLVTSPRRLGVKFTHISLC